MHSLGGESSKDDVHIDGCNWTAVTDTMYVLDLLPFIRLPVPTTPQKPRLLLITPCRLTWALCGSTPFKAATK